MFNILLNSLLFILFSHIYYGQEAPVSAIPPMTVLSSGACTIYDNQFYFYGGIYDRLDQSKYSTSLFKLNLEGELDTKTPKFEEIQNNFLSNQGLNYAFDSNGRVKVIGGLPKEENDFWVDIDLVEAKVKPRKELKDNLFRSVGTKVVNPLGTLTFNNIDNSTYYQFGGMVNMTNNKPISKPVMMIYNSNKDNVELAQDLNLKYDDYLSDHTATFFNNKIYFIGGTNPTRAQFHPISEVLCYNVILKNFTRIFTGGDIPSNRRGHSTTLINNEIYLIGGSIKLNSTQMEKEGYVYKLNLKTHLWSKVKVKGLINSYRGCLLNFQRTYLIYAFGLFDTKEFTGFRMISLKQEEKGGDGTKEEQAKDVEVDIGDWSDPFSTPPSKDSKPAPPSPYTLLTHFKNQVFEAEKQQLTYELATRATILGVSLAGVVGLILFLIMFFIFFRILMTTSPVLKSSLSRPKTLDPYDSGDSNPNKLFKFPSRARYNHKNEEESLHLSKLNYMDDSYMTLDPNGVPTSNDSSYKFSGKESDVQFSDQDNSLKQ